MTDAAPALAPTLAPLAWVRQFWLRGLFPGTPDANTRVRPLSLLLVLVLPAVLLYPCLSFHLLEPDEGRYALIPKEMLASGGWVVPTLEGEPYLDKPPLMYWLVALSYKLFGVSEASARLVPAVCVHLTILAVYLIGRRSVGERAAFWAATLLSVAPGFVGIARLLLLDGLLTLCVTTSVLCGFEAVRTGRLKLGWWIASAVCSGLGFLTKGPISEVLLFPPLLAFGWLNRGNGTRGNSSSAPLPVDPAGQPTSPSRGEVKNTATLFTSPLEGEAGTAASQPFRVGGGSDASLTDNAASSKPRWTHYLLFFAVVLAVNLPWYVAMLFQQPEFLRYFFWEHNVLRFVKPFDHLQPVWYYLPVLAGGFLPGMMLAVPYVRSLLRGGAAGNERSAAGGFWLMSGLWCVAFFSASGSKLPTYILPAFPPLCLALGEFVARSRWDKAFATRAIIAGFAVLLAVIHYVALPWYAKERSPMVHPDVVRKYVSDPTVPVVAYPRHTDSVSFYTGRGDIRAIRTKDQNEFLVECLHRPKTVILFTHDHSLSGFRETLRGAVDCPLRITDEVSLRRKGGAKWVDDLLGGGPWGLCDIAVVEPAPPKADTTPVKPEPVAQVSSKPQVATATLVEIADTEVAAAFSGSLFADDRDARIDAARARYQQALQQSPECREALVGLARLYIKTSSRPKAEELLRKATQLTPRHAETHHELTKCLIAFADWPAATEAARATLAIEPESRVYAKTLCVCLGYDGKWEEALGVLSRCCPEGETYGFVGMMAAKLGELDLGLKYLEVASKTDNSYGYQHLLLERRIESERPVRRTGGTIPPAK